MEQLIVNPFKGEIHMHTMANRSTVAAVLMAFLMAIPALAQQGQGQGEGQGQGQGQRYAKQREARGGGKGILVKVVISLNKLNATKGYECTADQAKKLLPVLRKLAVAKTMNKDEAGKHDQAVRKALTEKQMKKLDALMEICPPGKVQAGIGGPANPFYVAPGTKPGKGSRAEALHALIAALQKTAK